MTPEIEMHGYQFDRCWSHVKYKLLKLIEIFGGDSVCS